MRIPLKNWQPDLDGLTNPGQADIKNVYPLGGGGYGPMKALVAAYSGALGAQAIGAISAQDASGITKTFAGTASKLYSLDAGAGSFTDESKSGGYHVSSDQRWGFVQYGPRVIATNIGDPPQYYDLSGSGPFADLGGSPPQARHIAVIRDFVVLGNTTNGTSEVYWSGFNNSDQWTKGINQCDSQTLQGGGWIQHIVGGEVGYIFQEHAITRMTYVGPPLIFQFDLIEQQRGLAIPSAITTVGDVSYYYTHDGFYSFDPVNGSQPIGNNKVDNWFYNDTSSNNLYYMTAGVDPSKKLVIFSYRSQLAGVNDVVDTLLIYNRISQEWSYARIPHEMIFSSLTQGVTLDGMDSLYSSIENIPFSLDSRFWTGGDEELNAFTTAHKLGAFSGSTLAASMQTADFELTPGRRSFLTNARPFVDSISASIEVSGREVFSNSSVAGTTAHTMQQNGDFVIFNSARYHRINLMVSAGASWTYATGLDVDGQDDGVILAYPAGGGGP